VGKPAEEPARYSSHFLCLPSLFLLTPLFFFYLFFSFLFFSSFQDATSIASPHQQCRGLVQDLVKNVLAYLRVRMGSGLANSAPFNPMFGPSLSAINKELDSSTSVASRTRPPSLSTLVTALESSVVLLADSISRQHTTSREISNVEELPQAQINQLIPFDKTLGTEFQRNYLAKQTLNEQFEKEKRLTLSLICKCSCFHPPFQRHL